MSCTARNAEDEPTIKRPESRPEDAAELREGAIRETLEALAAEKREATQHYERGNLHFVNGEFEKASIEFRKALDISPFDPRYKAGLAKAEHALGKRSAE